MNVMFNSIKKKLQYQPCADSEGGSRGFVPLPRKIIPSLAHQRTAIEMAFHWWADDGLLEYKYGAPLPSVKYDD